MTNYTKLNQLVNLPLTCKYSRGYENWQTKYGTTPWLSGRVKDFQKNIADEGNFESAPIVKGVAIKDRNWETTPFDKSKWTSSYQWTFEKEGEEHKVTLTWLQNKNLQDELPEDIPNGGVKITPVFSGDTIAFDVEGSSVSRFTPEQIAEAEAKKEPKVEAVKEEEVVIDDLPF